MSYLHLRSQATKRYEIVGNQSIIIIIVIYYHTVFHHPILSFRIHCFDVRFLFLFLLSDIV